MSLLCLAQLLPAALLAQTKKVEIDVITLKSGQVFKGEVEEKNDSFVRFKTENGSRVYYMDDISSITKEEKEVPMTSEEKKQYKAQQTQANKKHEQNVELWKKRFPDYKRVTGFYADLSTSLGGAVEDFYKEDYKENMFYWSVDAVIGYRVCPYFAIGVGGGAGPVGRPKESGVREMCGRIYPLSVKSNFVHYGTGSFFADVKFAIELYSTVAYGGNFALGYSFPVGEWLHLNTSFLFSFMQGSYNSGKTIPTIYGYPSPERYGFRSFRYCFRVGLEF